MTSRNVHNAPNEVDAECDSNPIARAVGLSGGHLAAAILLLRIWFWMRYARLRPFTLRHRDDPRRWIVKPHEEWMQETGLSDRQVRDAFKRLTDTGLVTREPHKFKGKTMRWVTTNGCVGDPVSPREAAGSGAAAEREFREARESAGPMDERGSAGPQTRAKARVARNREVREEDMEKQTTERHQGDGRTSCGASPGACADDQGEVFSGRKIKITRDAFAAADGPRPTEADVVAMAEDARSTNRDMARVWHAALRARSDRFHPELRIGGADGGYLTTLRKYLPKGTAPVTLALVALRWDEFREYLIEERGWGGVSFSTCTSDANKISKEPSLSFIASQLESLAAWMHAHGTEIAQALA